jgi:hypothetical protein
MACWETRIWGIGGSGLHCTSFKFVKQLLMTFSNFGNNLPYRTVPVEQSCCLGPEEEDGEEQQQHGGDERQQRVVGAEAEEEQPGGDGGRQKAGADVGAAPPPQHHVPACITPNQLSI